MTRKEELQSIHGDLGKPDHDWDCPYILACAVSKCPCELRYIKKEKEQ